MEEFETSEVAIMAFLYFLLCAGAGVVVAFVAQLPHAASAVLHDVILTPILYL